MTITAVFSRLFEDKTFINKKKTELWLKNIVDVKRTKLENCVSLFKMTMGVCIEDCNLYQDFKLKKWRFNIGWKQEPSKYIFLFLNLDKCDIIHMLCDSVGWCFSIARYPDIQILLDIVCLYLTQLSPRWLAWTPGPKRASSPPSAFSSQRRLGRDKFSSRLVPHTKDPIIEKTLEDFTDNWRDHNQHDN